MTQSATIKYHYAWIVLAIIFIIMLCSAGIRATPSVLMMPLEHELGWSRSNISLAISISLCLYGITGPFSAAAMQYFGIKPTLLTAIIMLMLGSSLSCIMNFQWQFILIWGFLIGIGTGIAAMTLGATIVNRWFSSQRGLAMGLLSASTATGQLVFLPFMAFLVEQSGWRTVVMVLTIVLALLIPLVFFLLPESPKSRGLEAYGQNSEESYSASSRINPIILAFRILIEASRVKNFWLLFASFFICGASTNGFIGTHFIALCSDHGFNEVKGASLLAIMGIFDLFGTTLSGWLSDRYNSSILLFWYYGLRGLSLVFLPYAFGFELWGIPLFVFFYGLDWIATVPPTIRLTNESFGSIKAPIVFGWIFTGHQLGAALAALFSGITREYTGNYDIICLIIGITCIVTAFMALLIKYQPQSVKIS